MDVFGEQNENKSKKSWKPNPVRLSVYAHFAMIVM